MAGDYPGNIATDPALGHAGEWAPADLGFIAWAFDPVNYQSGSLLSAGAVAGKLVVVRLRTPAALVTNIVINVTTAGATLTSGQNFAGLYQNGALVGTTADQSVAWVSATVKTMALSGGPFAVGAGDVYAAFFFNGTTSPTLQRAGSNQAAISLGTAATASRFGTTTDTGRTTTMPATLGTISAVVNSYWAALS